MGVQADSADDTVTAGSGDDAFVASGAETLDALAEAGSTDEVGGRDERRDSIDPATGTLTAEAVAIRRAEQAAAAED